MKFSLAAAVGICLIATLATSRAQAQDSGGNFKMFSDQLRASAGGMLASDSQLQNEGHQGWVLLNLSHDFRKPTRSRLLDFFAYFDAATTGGTTNRGILSYDNFSRSFMGMGIGARVRLTPPMRPFGIYGSAGVGLYNIDRNLSHTYRDYSHDYYDPETGYKDDPGTNYTRSINSRNKFSLGFKFGGGISFGRGLYLEANYFNAGKLDDVRYSGLGLAFGSRL